jgi:hypothetical protein
MKKGPPTTVKITATFPCESCGKAVVVDSTLCPECCDLTALVARYNEVRDEVLSSGEIYEVNDVLNMLNTVIGDLVPEKEKKR